MLRTLAFAALVAGCAQQPDSTGSQDRELNVAKATPEEKAAIARYKEKRRIEEEVASKWMVNPITKAGALLPGRPNSQLSIYCEDDGLYSVRIDFGRGYIDDDFDEFSRGNKVTVEARMVNNPIFSISGTLQGRRTVRVPGKEAKKTINKILSANGKNQYWLYMRTADYRNQHLRVSFMTKGLKDITKMPAFTKCAQRPQ